MNKDPRHLHRALVMESRAVARSRIFAKKARMEERGDLRALFRAATRSQEVALRRCLMMLRGKIDSDLGAVLEGFLRETGRRQETYQDLEAQATAAGDGLAAATYQQSQQVAARQLELAQSAAAAVAAQPPRYLVCTVCGYLALDDPPDSCPVCGAIPLKFEEVK